MSNHRQEAHNRAHWISRKFSGRVSSCSLTCKCYSRKRLPDSATRESGAIIILAGVGIGRCACNLTTTPQPKGCCQRRSPENMKPGIASINQTKVQLQAIDRHYLKENPGSSPCAHRCFLLSCWPCTRRILRLASQARTLEDQEPAICHDLGQSSAGSNLGHRWISGTRTRAFRAVKFL